MPAKNKVGTQLLVYPHVRADGQALALVRQESAAEIWRDLISAQLPLMKRAHRAELLRLDEVLTSIGGDRVELLEQITRRKLRYADLFDQHGQPVTELPAHPGQ